MSYVYQTYPLQVNIRPNDSAVTIVFGVEEIVKSVFCFKILFV
jgi:hypothetical protein